MRIFGSVERLHAALDYHLQRQNLLAANLANVDTPNYRCRDLVRSAPSFEGELGTALATTEDGHLAGAAASSGSRVEIDRSVAPGADGNSVNLDREVVKISANHLRYEALSTLTSQRLSQIAWAATDGRGG